MGPEGRNLLHSVFSFLKKFMSRLYEKGSSLFLKAQSPAPKRCRRSPISPTRWCRKVERPEELATSVQSTLRGHMTLLPPLCDVTEWRLLQRSNKPLHSCQCHPGVMADRCWRTAPLSRFKSSAPRLLQRNTQTEKKNHNLNLLGCGFLICSISPLGCRQLNPNAVCV